MRRPTARRIAATASFVTMIAAAAIVGHVGGFSGTLTGETATLEPSISLSLKVTLSGSIQQFHADGFGNKQSTLRTFITPTGTSTRYEVIGSAASTLRAGSISSVTGSLQNGVVSASSATTVTEPKPSSLLTKATLTTTSTDTKTADGSLPTTGGLKMAMVILEFSDMTNPMTAAQAQSAIMTGPRSTAKYLAESSYGAAGIQRLDVHGPFRLSRSKSVCSDPWVLASASRAAFAAYANYDYVIYSVPNPGNCTGAGWAYLNTNESWVATNDDVTGWVASHELGHNFGMMHAKSLTCEAPATTSFYVSYSASCVGSDYGDAYDTMGVGGLHQYYNRRNAGWAPASESQTVTTTGNVKLHPLNVKFGATDAYANVIIPAPSTQTTWPGFGSCGAYAVEYRTATGLDSAIQPGVVVRRVNNCKPDFYTFAYDGSPWMTGDGDRDLAFSPGHSFEDVDRRISVRVLSMTPDEAVIRVAFEPDVTPPKAPSRPTVTPIDGSTARLTPIFDATDDRHVQHYEMQGSLDFPGTTRVWRGWDGKFEWGPLRVALVDGQVSGFSLRAVDAAGNKSATALDLAPTVPKSFTVSHSGGRNYLSWTASTDDQPGITYQVRRGETVIGTTSSTSYSEAIDRSGWFAYYVRAVDAAGNQSNWTTQWINVDLFPPTNPTNLRVTNQWYSWIDLAWSPSTDDVGVATYRIHRESDNALLAEVPGSTTTWRHGNLPVNSGHTYYVRAMDAFGNLSGRTGALYAQTERDNPPSTPTNFRVSDTGRTWIGLQWADSSDDRGVAGYRIYRASDGAQIGTSTSSWWRHEGLPSDQSRSYFVKAVDGSGFLSAKSVNVTGRTLK